MHHNRRIKVEAVDRAGEVVLVVGNKAEEDTEEVVEVDHAVEEVVSAAVVGENRGALACIEGQVLSVLE